MSIERKKQQQKALQNHQGYQVYISFFMVKKKKTPFSDYYHHPKGQGLSSDISTAESKGEMGIVRECSSVGNGQGL